MKHYFQPGRDEFRRTLAGKLPALIGGTSDSKPLDPLELRTQLKSMKPKTWKRIRDELISALPSETGGATSVVTTLVSDVASAPIDAS